MEQAGTLAFHPDERRSQFRVRAVLVGRGMRPFGWEIYDDEDGKTVRRSSDRFRNSTSAWHAGSATLDRQGNAGT